jgi:tripartite-type tricarboxylate transporter receptor subunit TctC
VTTLNRWSVAPEIPPFNEAGVPGFAAAGWFMVAGPANTPKPIVERLHADFKIGARLFSGRGFRDRNGRGVPARPTG